MKKDSITQTLNREISNLSKDAIKAVAHRAAMDTQLKRLQKMGIIRGTLWVRDSKYTYLLHPSKVGEKRKRDYLGIDQKAIEKVGASIARVEQFDELTKAYSIAEANFRDAMHYLSLARAALQKIS